ncbi:MAG: M23 family metallopeptidase [Bacteroidales bacterium]|nr:M23 family metallopeptidase [Bacteroidales bacterium]
MAQEHVEDAAQEITQQLVSADNVMSLDTSSMVVFFEESEMLSFDEIEQEFTFDELDQKLETSNVEVLPDVPAMDIYQVWSSNVVNPYNIRLTNKADTTLIDLRNYVHPMNNVVTSEFGFRSGYRFHYGIDVRLKRGDSVLCAFDGKVRIAKRGQGYGFYVLVRHYNGLETIYGHFSKLAVKPHDEVKAGDLLGYGGSTGRSTGPHLHLEVRYLGVPIDPRMIIDFENYAIKSDTLQLNAAHFAYAKEIDQVRFWTIRKGDTLGRIAQQTGVSINKLCQLNKITTKSILQIGRKIRYS